MTELGLCLDVLCNKQIDLKLCMTIGFTTFFFWLHCLQGFYFAFNDPYIGLLFFLLQYSENCICLTVFLKIRYLYIYLNQIIKVNIHNYKPDLQSNVPFPHPLTRPDMFRRPHVGEINILFTKCGIIAVFYLFYLIIPFNCIRRIV